MDLELDEFGNVQLIGSGAFSKVYKGRYDNKEVAIKILEKKSSSHIESFKREIFVMEQLDHKNVVKLLQYRETQNKLYIIQEFVKGQTLSDYMKTHTPTESDIKNIIQQLLEVVSYLHNMNIIHRDIKPENILLTEDNLLKLIDFGLSQQSEQRLSYDKCGTLLYMAPEMILKQPYVKSVDIWSIGIVMYQLCTGKHPFWEKQETVPLYVEQIQKNEVDFSKMDKFAISFYQKCSAILNDARMTAEQALSHPWISGQGDLGQPITMADMLGMFDKQQKFVNIIKLLVMMKSFYTQNENYNQVKQLRIPLQEYDNDTTSETKRIHFSRNGSRGSSLIKQARSTSSLFYETSNYSPYKKQQSPFRSTMGQISPIKKPPLRHSISMNFQQLCRRQSQTQKLPYYIQTNNFFLNRPISGSSNSPIGSQKKSSSKKINIQFKLKQ